MKKLSQKAGAIGALLFALIPAFFMAACSTDAAVDVAAVKAALNAEKGKYLTAVNLSGQKAGDEVSGKVVELMAGKEPNPAITRGVFYALSGQMILTGEGDLMFQSDKGAAETDPDKETDHEETAARSESQSREAMEDIQVVILQFEKDGITSNLDVLCALKGGSSNINTWLGYGYDDTSKQAKNPVLDMTKLNAASWIKQEGGSDSFKYSDPELNAEVLAMFAAQSFIDDVLSGKTLTDIQATYGTHLIAKAPAGGPKLSNLGTPTGSDLISLFDMVETVKEMHLWQDVGRQVSDRTAPKWVSAVDIVTYSNAKTGVTIRDDWYTVLNVYTGSQWETGQGTYKPVDFNDRTSGPHIYGLFQGTSDPKKAIADIAVIEGKNTKTPDGWEKINIDLNKGGGGTYLYLIYRMVNETDTEAVTWIGGWSTWQKIMIKSVTDAISMSDFKWDPAKKGEKRWVYSSPNVNNYPQDMNAHCGPWSGYVYMIMEKKLIPR